MPPIVGVVAGEFFDNLVCVKSGILKNVAGRLPLLGVVGSHSRALSC